MAVIEGIVEMTLQARDRERLERFYQDVVGLELLAREDDRTWLAVGPRARLGLWTPGEKEFGDEGGEHVHFAFGVTPGGLDELRGRLERGGAAALRGPVEHPGGDRSLYWEDPEGNVVEAWDFFARGRSTDDLQDG